MADDAISDPDFTAGRVLRLEADLRETGARLKEERQEREDHDTLVSAALADVRDAVHELQTELVRQGGITARTHRIAEAVAEHLGINPNRLEDAPDVPVLSRMQDAEEAILELRRRRGRLASQPDPREAEAPLEAPARPAAPPERPITASWRPRSAADWGRLAVMVALALGALGAAAQQIASALAGH